MTRSFFHPQFNLMNKEQLDRLRTNYANWIVENADLSTVLELAADLLEQNMKDFEEEDFREEILDYYGEETWTFLNKSE